MAISLQKGERISLEKSMKLALISLGWSTNKYDGRFDFDLDVSAFLLDENGKLVNDSDFIFYNNLRSRNDAVIHAGDNRTGDGDGEEIIIEFAKVPENIAKIAICITIHDAEARQQNFGQVSNAYVRVSKIDSESDKVGELALRFDLGEEFSIETAVVVCEIYKRNDEWKFNAIGDGYQGGLEAICKSFGANV